MQCARCATPVPAEAKFCHSCGSLVSGPDGATAMMDSSDLQELEELLRQDTQGEFTIQGRLGRGGMAVVYLATEIHLARQVAIKVLPRELTFGHGVERFKREAKTAAALDHPHIIPIYRIASGGKIFWYAMKYLEGRSLEDVLKEKGRLSLEETVHILTQVAKALDYAHKRRVIHRDIKPANIMLDSENRVVVTDFGIAKALTEGTLTASGSVVGTPYYMSPEQGMGREVTGAADQYSVGVMAYRMLSGQVPFEGDSAIDILHKHCTEPPPPLEVIRAGLPEHVSLAVHRALEKKREQRFPSVSAFVEALIRPAAGPSSAEAATQVTTGGRSLSGGGPAAHTVAPRPAAVAAPRRGGRIGMIAGIGVAAVAAAASLWLWRGRGQREGSPGPTAVQEGVAPAPSQGDRAQPSGAAVEPQPIAAAPAPTATEARTEPRATPPASTTGHVTISGLPAGGTITVNGRRQSGSGFELAAGGHEIRMEAPGFEAVVATVLVAAGERMTVPFTGRPVPAQTTQPPVQAPAAVTPVTPTAVARLGVLLLTIEPEADVFLDEVYRGRQTVRSDTLEPGAHLLRVARDGYRTLDTTLRLTAGQIVRLEVRLERRNP